MVFMFWNFYEVFSKWSVLAVKSLQVEFSDAGTDGTGLAPEMGGQLLLRSPFAPHARQLQILRFGPGQIGVRILLAADLTKVGKNTENYADKRKKRSWTFMWGYGASGRRKSKVRSPLSG